MKLFFKRAFLLLLVSPLVIGFGVVFIVEKLFAFIGDWPMRIADKLDDIQRTRAFDSWIVWARKVSKLNVDTELE